LATFLKTSNIIAKHCKVFFNGFGVFLNDFRVILKKLKKCPKSTKKGKKCLRNEIWLEMLEKMLSFL
jgi:hypothetical protein